MCFMALPVCAQIMDTPCAGGSGVVVKGKLKGEYCMSDKGIGNWWNAVSWCDAQGKQLVSMSDDCGCDIYEGGCGRSDSQDGYPCPNFSLTGRNINEWIWMQDATSASSVHSVKLDNAKSWPQYRSGNMFNQTTYAMCK